MTPEEVICELEKIIHLEYDGDLSDGPPRYAIDCIRDLLARAKRAEDALGEIDSIIPGREYSTNTLTQTVIRNILDTYYKEAPK